jgi:hypothetical protein
MGAGASARAEAGAENKNSWVVSEIKDPQNTENHLVISSPLVLIVTRESLDLTPVDHSDTTVLHYPYYQIKCWSSSPSFFSFQLGVEKRTTVFKFKTTEGSVIQKNLLETILKFMAQSKDGALQPLDFKELQNLLFDSSKSLVPNWMEVADEFFKTRPFRLTAAHSMDLLADIDMSDGFFSLDFCCMLHQYILNQDSFKLVMNSISDKQLKLNLASRLGINQCDSDGVTVQAPQDSDPPASDL